MIERAAVIAEARSRLGRPWVHQHADCRAFITDVAAAFGIEYRGPTDYARAPDGVALLDECDAHLVRIAVAAMQPADIVVMHFDGMPHHIGFLARHGERLTLIHASNMHGHGKVVEQPLMHWREKIVVAYQLPGIEP